MGVPPSLRQRQEIHAFWCGVAVAAGHDVYLHLRYNELDESADFGGRRGCDSQFDRMQMECKLAKNFIP